MWRWTLAAHQSYREKPHPRGTRPALHVLRGQFTVHAGESVHPLGQDSMLFRTDVDHAYENPGRAAAEFVTVVIEQRRK